MKNQLNQRVTFLAPENNRELGTLKFSTTAHAAYLIAAIGMVGIYGKQIHTFRQRLKK